MTNENEPAMPGKSEREEVTFGGGWVIGVGLLASVAIAFGLPAIVVVYGQSMGAIAQTIIILCALLAGGVIGAISTFFGIVIPKKVTEGGGRHGWHGPHIHVKEKGKEVFVGPEGVKVVEVSPASPAPAGSPSAGESKP